MVAKCYEAWIVVSPSATCDEVMRVEQPANDSRAERNVWIEWDGDASQARVLVTAFALAAIVQYL